MDSKVDASSLASLKNLILKLFLNLGNHFLDACRMDSSIHDKLMQSESRHFPADRIESREKDSVRRVVNDNLHSGRGLKGPDVTSLTSDDTSLDLVILNRECRHGILDGGLGGSPLDGVDHDSLGLLGSVETSLVHRVVDVGLRLCPCLCLHVLHEDVLGILGAHPRDCLQLLVSLRAQSLIFLSLSRKNLLLRLEA